LRNWHDINQERLRYINYSEKKVAADLRKLNRKFRQMVKDLGPDAALAQLSETDIKNSVEQIYVDVYTVTGVAFARSTVKNLNNRVKRKDTAETLTPSWTRHMQNFARTRCGIKIQSVTRNIFDDIENITRNIVSANPEQGPAWIANRIYEQVGERDHWRALRIARTEVVGASNEGAITGAREYGIKTKKKWLVNLDSLTRDDHAAMADHPIIDVDDSFSVGDDTMDYPGDPSASAGNVINCRCAITFRPERDIVDDLLSGNYDENNPDIY
jgi:hypothetical protein